MPVWISDLAGGFQTAGISVEDVGHHFDVWNPSNQATKHPWSHSSFLATSESFQLWSMNMVSELMLLHLMVDDGVEFA